MNKHTFELNGDSRKSYHNRILSPEKLIEQEMILQTMLAISYFQVETFNNFQDYISYRVQLLLNAIVFTPTFDQL